MEGLQSQLQFLWGRRKFFILLFKLAAKSLPFLPLADNEEALCVEQGLSGVKWAQWVSAGCVWWCPSPFLSRFALIFLSVLVPQGLP